MKVAGRLVLLGLIGCGSGGGANPGGDAATADRVLVDVVDGGGASDGAASDVPTADVVTPEALAARVYQALLGRFDSADQAAADRRFFAIQLQTCAIAVPDLGPRVMYVEQARMDSLAAPYRQRLYVVEPADDGVRSRVFEFLNPASVVGLCARAGTADVRVKDVVEREGCAVLLRPMGASFVGGTVGRSCESTLMGARYATSEVTLTDSGLDSLDRGYNATGMQVWGSTAGPYRFVRRTPLGE